MNNDETMLTETEASTIIKKCPNCGGALKFDITTENLVCAHCRHIQEIEAEDRVMRRQLTDEVRNTKSTWDNTTVFRCDSCGAKEVLTGKEITRRCPFCGSSNIVSINELSGVQPDSLIPFKIDINTARNNFKKWLGSKWMAPRAFKTYDIRECMTALYCPSWSFTTQVQSNYNGTLSRTQHVTTRNRQGQMITTSHMVHFNARGNMNLQYTDHLIQSSDKISHIVFNKLKPFDLKELKVYRTEFLTGIITQHYTKTLDDCFNDFSNFIRTDLRRKIMQKHMADSVQRLDINLHFATKQFNYILLPLYVANYTYRGKPFNFYINGVSGKTVGHYPKSRLKALAIALGIGLVVGGLIGLIYIFTL